MTKRGPTSVEEILEAFSGWSERVPDQLAATDQAVSLSYQQLAGASDFVAASLAEHGLKPGDITVFMGSNGVQRVVAYLGFLKAGVATVFLDPRNPPATWREWADHAGAKTLIQSADIIDTGDALAGLSSLRLPYFGRDEYPHVLPVETHHSPDLLAYLSYTSGSTGKPKGVPVRRSMEALYVALASKVERILPGARTAISGQLWPEMILAPLTVGASFHTYDFAGLGADGLSKWLADERINIFSTYTAAARALDVGPETRWPDLEMFRVAGEAVLKADVERLAKAMPTGSIIENSFGLSEYPWISGYKHVVGEPITFDGMPLGYAYEPERFVLLGEDGQKVGPNEVGEIAICSPETISGYWKDPDRSAQVLRRLSPNDTDLTFFTGDFATQDENGLIRGVGRADEQIKIRGYNVRPTEIEAILSQMPGLHETAVVPFLAPNGIRRLACHYVNEAGYHIDAAALRSFLKERVPAYMVPGHFLYRTEFPRTRTGKIDRKKLPNPTSLGGDRSADRETVLSPVEQIVHGIWADVLGHQEFSLDDDFFDVGGDSLQAMAVITEISQRAGLSMPLEAMVLEGATIRDFVSRIETHKGFGDSGTTQLKRGGSGQPMFAVPVIGGHLSDYLAVAHALEGHHPVAGLAFDITGHQNNPQAVSVVGLAEQAMSSLPDTTGDSEIVILGYSFGGAVGLELARLLAGNGRKVSLIIVDTVPVWRDRWRHWRTAWRAMRQGDVAASAGRIASALGDRSAQSSVEEAHIRAGNSFEPRTIKGVRTLLIRSTENSERDALLAEWQDLVRGEMTVADTEGDHFTMMRGENAESVARKVREWLS